MYSPKSSAEHSKPWAVTAQTILSTHDKKALALKVFSVLLGIYSLYEHEWIGLIVVMFLFSVDLIMSRTKTDSVGFLFKLFLLLQGLLIWYVAAKSVRTLSLVDSVAGVQNRFISNKYSPYEEQGAIGRGLAQDQLDPKINMHHPDRMHKDFWEDAEANKELEKAQHDLHSGTHQALRGKPAFVEPFSLDGLAPAPPLSSSWTMGDRAKFEKNEVPADSKKAHQALCNAAVLLDIAALKYLLYDYGVAPDAVVEGDARRNAFHCLASLYLHADASPTSLVFSLLKGTPSWATKLYDPPLPPKGDSIISSDVLTSLEPHVEKVAKYLQRAGVPPSAKDAGGNTPLHMAAYGGSIVIMRVLIEMGADVNAVNNDGRTPIHFALAQGQAAAGSVLFYAKADMDFKDKYRVTPRDLVINPGPIYPADALKYFEMEQRAAKQIERVIHPELNSDPKLGWAAGSGGWSTQRLKGYEEDMECLVVDQYWADEITADDVFYKYLARNAPVLIRGLIDKWGVVEEYKQENLVKNHGHLEVQVSDIPYSVKFGGNGSVDMTLGHYIDTVNQHSIVGGAHPWYVFKGHPVPSGSDEDPQSLVPIENCPTPPVLQGAFGDAPDAEDRSIFVNAQWALGGEGTGAPVHFHNTAWNALIYGAKKWAVYPPRDKIMSNEQILEFSERSQTEFCNRGVCPVTCTQVAGDVMIIPESWGHGVLNIQQSIAVATEVKGAMWRLTPGMRSIQNARQEAIRLGYMPPSAGRQDRGRGAGGRGGGRGGPGAGRGGREEGGRGGRGGRQ